MTDYNAIVKTGALADTSAQEYTPDGKVNYNALAVKQETTPSGGEQFDISAAVNKYVSPVVQDIGKHYSAGENSVANGLLYAKVLKGEISQEEALSQETPEDQTPDFTPYIKPLAPLVESLPALKAIAIGGGEGALAVGAAGAAVGGTAGAIGGPAAPATVPAGAIAGAIAGGEMGLGAGTLYTGAEIAAGSALRDLVKAGVPADKAKPYALATGLAVGALQKIGLGAAGKQVLSAMAKQLAVKGAEETAQQVATGAVQKLSHSLMSQAAKNYYKAFGIHLADNVAINLTSTLVPALGKALNGVNVEIKDLGNRLVNDFVSAVELAAVTPAIAKGIGTALGKAKAIHQTPDVSDIHKTFVTLGKLLNGEEIPDKAGYENLVPKTGKEIEAQRKADFEQREAERKVEAAKLAEDVQKASELENAKGEKLSSQQDAKGHYQTPKARLRQQLKQLGSSIHNWRDLLNTAFQYLPKGQRQVLIDALDFRNKLANVKEAQTRHFIYLMSEIEKSTGLPLDKVFRQIIGDSDINSLRDKSDTAVPRDKEGFPQFLSSEKDSTGAREVQSFKGSKMQAAYLLEAMEMAERQEGVQPHEAYNLGADEASALKATLKKQGYTFKSDIPDGQSTQAILEQVLDKDPATRQVVDGVKNYYKNHNLPLLSKAHELNTGQQLQAVPGYFGRFHREVPGVQEGSTPYQDFLSYIGADHPSFSEQRGPNQNLLPPRSTKARTANEYPLELRNPVSDAITAAFNTAQYSELFGVAKTMNQVFNNGKTRSNFDKNFGSDFKYQVDAHLHDMLIGRPNFQGVYIGALNRWMANFGHKLLQVNPVRYIKHYFQVTTYGLADVGGGKQMPATALWSGILDYYKDPATANNYLWRNSQALRNKYVNNTRQAIIGGIREADISELAKSNTDEFLSTFLIKGAEHADQAGMHAVIKYMKEQGASDEQAMAVAEKALEETQFSNSIDQLSNASRNPYLKVFTQFTQYPQAMFSRQLTAWREAANFPTKENVYNAFRTSAITHLGQALFIGVDTAYVFSVSSDPNRRRDSLLHLGSSVALGPLPLSLDRIATDFGKGAEDLITRGLKTAGADVEVSHNHYYGFETLPVSVIKSGLYDTPMAAYKAVNTKMETGSFNPVELLDVLLSASRAIEPRITPIAQTSKDIAKKQQEQE